MLIEEVFLAAGDGGPISRVGVEFIPVDPMETITLGNRAMQLFPTVFVFEHPSSARGGGDEKGG